jgi:hypothetical protein
MEQRAWERARVIITLILVLVLLGSSSISVGTSVILNDHPQPGIWELSNEKNRPTQALLLNLDRTYWQAQTAACFAPVFFDRFSQIPLFYDDGTGDQDMKIPHEKKSVSEFGSDASSATGGIATTYWTKAEIIVVAGTYEEILWAVPIASFLDAPILVNPTSATLDTLKTKCAVVVGTSDVNVDEKIHLETKNDVWKFQLELYDTKGYECNYMIVTNPQDILGAESPNINFPFMSLASAPLSSFRRALVQTGDYTGEKQLLDQIHKKTSEDDTLYKQIEPDFKKVKEDCMEVMDTFIEMGHTPGYMDLVGGPFAIPDYYYDIHTQYLYWSQEVHYVPSASPYASMQKNVPNNLTIKEDLGIGRIVALSILDATNLLMRTFFYREYLKGGMFYEYMVQDWEHNATVVDGHRLNQPRNGGPPHTSSLKPFFPAGEIKSELINNTFATEYVIPKNKTDPWDTNPSKAEILHGIQNKSMIQLVAHGGSMANPSTMWMEGGYDLLGDEESNKHKILASDVSELDMSPSMVYVIACHTGHIFLDMDKNDLLPLAFIHAGVVAYIAPVTCQSICFWSLAPEGVAATQAIYFWKNVLTSNMAVSEALAKAKWDAYQEWKLEDDPREEPDGPAFHLFGDPALEPFKPNVPLEDIEEMDIHIDYNEEKGKLNVNVDITDLTTSQTIADAQITIKFNGETKSGGSATYEMPDDEGDYPLEVTVSKEGYEALSAGYVTSVEEGEEEASFVPILGLTFVIIAIIAIVMVNKRRKKYKESE